MRHGVTNPIALLAGAVSLVAGAPVHAASPPRYTVTDFGKGDAVGINNSGLVLVNEGLRSVARQKNGNETAVGPRYSVAVGVNDKGDVIGVGSRDNLIGGKPYIWSNYRVNYFIGESVRSLNNKNSVTVEYYATDGTCPGSSVGDHHPDESTFDRAFAVINNIRIEITNLDGSSGHVQSYVEGINDKDKFVGTAVEKDCVNVKSPEIQNPKPFWYHDGKMFKLPDDLDYNDAVFINNKDQIVGSLGNGHAYLLSAGRGKDIGTLGGDTSVPKGINYFGVVVGTSDINSYTENSHAFIYIEDKLLDLNDLVDGLGVGVILTSGIGVNNKGQIVAEGELSGERRVFVLDPVAK